MNQSYVFLLKLVSPKSESLSVIGAGEFESDEAAKTELHNVATRRLKELYGEITNRTLVECDNKYNIIFNEEKDERGWMSNYKVTQVHNEGYFTFSKTNIFDDLKNKLIAKSSELNESECENKNLTHVIEALEENYNKSLETNYKQTLKLSKLEREFACNKHVNISQANMIVEMRAKLQEKEKEIVSLREDAKYAVKTAAVPRKHRASTGSWDSVVFELRDFDRTKLKHVE